MLNIQKMEICTYIKNFKGIKNFKNVRNLKNWCNKK